MAVYVMVFHTELHLVQDQPGLVGIALLIDL